MNMTKEEKYKDLLPRVEALLSGDTDRKYLERIAALSYGT